MKGGIALALFFFGSITMGYAILQCYECMGTGPDACRPGGKDMKLVNCTGVCTKTHTPKIGEVFLTINSRLAFMAH